MFSDVAYDVFVVQMHLRVRGVQVVDIATGALQVWKYENAINSDQTRPALTRR